MSTYAGIGSRETPDDVLELMGDIAAELARLDWTLRSGCAPGADTAFERAAVEVAGYTAVELFLPWPGFEGRTLDDLGPFGLDRPKPETGSIAEAFHPNWNSLSRSVRLLHCRNVHQVLGPNVSREDRSVFVVCWTKDGKRGGGTGQALRIAEGYGVPIFDLAIPRDRERVELLLTS